VTLSSLAVTDRDYIAYLADNREVTDPAAGSVVQGTVKLALPPGHFNVSLYSPVTGQSSPAVAVENDAVLTLPPFHDDIVIRARRTEP
jgi:hypothetical protein